VVSVTFNTDGLVGTIDIGPRDAENWRACVVDVRADGFTAHYVCSVRDQELRRLVSDIEGALARLGQRTSVEFCALERGFALKIELNALGHIDGEYEFCRDWPGPCLSGSFAADQTHLVIWAKELTQALAM
jgi:hypothetical protein